MYHQYKRESHIITNTLRCLILYLKDQYLQPRFYHPHHGLQLPRRSWFLRWLTLWLHTQTSEGNTLGGNNLDLDFQTIVFFMVAVESNR